METKTEEQEEIDEVLKDYVMKDIIRQRYKLLDSQNFLADVVLSLKPQVVTHAKGNSVDTAATDGVSLFVNPFCYCKLSDEHAMSLIMHEGAHKFLGHPWRMGDRDHYLFNIAGDHAANNLILESGQQVPDDWCCDRKYKNWTSERIYADLKRKKRKRRRRSHPRKVRVAVSLRMTPVPEHLGLRIQIVSPTLVHLRTSQCQRVNSGRRPTTRAMRSRMRIMRRSFAVTWRIFLMHASTGGWLVAQRQRVKR